MRKGFKHSEEARKKMSEGHKGKQPWNAGKKDLQVAWNKGKTGIYSEETRKKISEATKKAMSNPEIRKKLSQAKKGEPSWNKGKKGFQVAWNKGKPAPWAKNLPQAFKKGYPTWNKGLIGFMAGEKSPLWKGGISFEPYSPEWTKALKESILQRDNYTCQLCHKKGTAVHHIDYNKKNSNPENLITLCANCHSKTNVNREKWIKFFKNKVLKR